MYQRDPGRRAQKNAVPILRTPMKDSDGNPLCIPPEYRGEMLRKEAGTGGMVREADGYSVQPANRLAPESMPDPEHRAEGEARAEDVNLASEAASQPEHGTQTGLMAGLRGLFGGGAHDDEELLLLLAVALLLLWGGAGREGGLLSPDGDGIALLLIGYLLLL